MLIAELLEFLEYFGHFVRAIVLMLPDFESFASAEDQIDAAVVFKASWVFGEPAKKDGLENRISELKQRSSG